MFKALMVAAAVLLDQNGPRVTLLEQQGWAAIEDGKHAEAAEAFRAAITLDPRNPELRLGAGVADFLRRHDAEAKRHLEVALELDPRFTRARAQLAQVFKRQGDLNEAIRQYEIVAGEAPADASVRDTLERWKRERELHDRMLTTVDNFFIVSFEGAKDSAMASQALESLNRAYWRITDVFATLPPKTIPVVLYSGEQFQDITRSPKWAAAAFDGIIRVPMKGAGEQGEDLDRVLAHEFTHALVRSLATRGLPAWLNEGLASALEGDTIAWATARLSNAERVPPLSQLAAPFSGLSGSDAQIAYAASARAARRLLDEAGGPAIANLLRDLGAGVPFEDAFAHRVQMSLAAFEAALNQ
jgi:hypothetical protein